MEGMFQSIVNAHNTMFRGRVFYSEFPVKNVGINRSPASYLANPEAERNLYSEDIDRNMQQIRFVNATGQLMGAFNWLASRKNERILEENIFHYIFCSPCRINE